MPPSAVKTIKDLIYWQYGKIIADSAGIGKKNYGFVMNRFKKLQREEINWSSSIREYVKEREKMQECIYCGKEEKRLTQEHLLPVSRGGEDREGNSVWVCQSCNSSKGSKRLYEWMAHKEGMKAAKYETPRIAEGKYLKLLYRMHEERGTLSLTEKELEVLCEDCDMGAKCPEGKSLSLYCLEGIFTKL